MILALVEHLLARGEVLAARACLDLLAQAPAPPADILIAQAHLRFALGEVDIALQLAERGIAAGAEGAGDLHLYAMLLQFSGHIDQACDVLERCLRQAPQFADAAMVLVNLRKQTPEGHRLAWLEGQINALPAVEAANPEQRFLRAEFEYACFKTLEDLGRPADAWAALERCNRLMRELNPYDAAAENSLVSALMQMPTAPLGTDRPEYPDGPIPIFIVGMPRSGTTLLDRMLSSHSQVESAGEIIEFWRQLHWVANVVPAKSDGLKKVIARADAIDYTALGRRYLQQTRWRARGRAFYIDKLPANIQMVGFIRRALPHAPILHMVRDPMDTCWSNYKAMFGNVSPYSYDIEALAHYFLQYRRLADHWHQSLPGAMLDVPYSDLVQEPAKTIGNVLDYCGLALEAACFRPELNPAPVATPSSHQVRESVHTRGIGQWRRYEDELATLRRLLRPAIED